MYSTVNSKMDKNRYDVLDGRKQCKNRWLMYHLNCDAKYKIDLLHFFTIISQGYPLDGKITNQNREKNKEKKIVKYQKWPLCVCVFSFSVLYSVRR